jgi:hypothetical protein
MHGVVCSVNKWYYWVTIFHVTVTADHNLHVLMKHFKGFGSRFTTLHAKLDADMLLDFASVANKMKHKVEKALV